MAVPFRRLVFNHANCVVAPSLCLPEATRVLVVGCLQHAPHPMSSLMTQNREGQPAAPSRSHPPSPPFCLRRYHGTLNLRTSVGIAVEIGANSPRRHSHLCTTWHNYFLSDSIQKSYRVG